MLSVFVDKQNMFILFCTEYVFSFVHAEIISVLSEDLKKD